MHRLGHATPFVVHFTALHAPCETATGGRGWSDVRSEAPVRADDEYDPASRASSRGWPSLPAGGPTGTVGCRRDRMIRTQRPSLGDRPQSLSGGP
jgi:hypothetical protein